MSGALISRPVDPGTVDAENPWPGLASFREADRDLFYGREAETQELLRLALRERLTVLFGLSGLGKTSLLRAGLFPLLRQENVLPVYIRLDFSDEGIRRTLSGQVREAIGREAAAAEIEAPAFPEGETLWESLHRQGAEFWSPRNRIVTPLFVFDQFEEIFTLGRGNTARAQEAEAFLAELADFCEGSIPAGLRARLEADPSATRELSLTKHPYKILLSLREDFLPELEGLRGRIRSIVHNRYRLRRMNGDNALRVVTQAGGHLVEPDVPERIVRFVAGRESGDIPLAELDIEPALLSVVCRELNNRRRSQGLPRITVDLVQGNRDEIISGLYERSIEDLGPEVRSFIEERLLTKSGFRDSVARENVVEVSQEVLDKLTDRRLLRVEDHGGMQRLELTHDVLTGVIRKSRDRRREREAGEREEAARREAERKLRRSRRALALLGLVLLGVAALAAWGFTAQRKAGKALASSYLERAASLQDSSPAHALAYLAQAIREEPESVPAQSLLTDLLLYRSWPRPVAELRSNDAEWVQLSDDGHLFIAASEGGGVIRIWDTRTLRKVGEVRQFLPIKSVEISRDGRLLLIVSPGSAELWETRTQADKSLWRIDIEEYMAIPRLSPDGRWVAWIRGRQNLVLRDNTTQRERAIPSQSLLIKTGFSPDSRRIFAGTYAQGILLWDVESGRSLPAPRAAQTQDVAFSSDGRYLLATGFPTTTLWDLETQTEKRVDSADRGWLSPGGKRVALYSSGEIDVWTVDAASPERLMAIPMRELYHADFSQDGRRLLTVSDGGVELWDVATGLLESQAFCECLHGRFLPGTREIVTGDDIGVLRVWSPEPTRIGTELYDASEPTSMSSVFSRDGSRIAIQDGEGKVHLWDMDTVQPLGEPLGEIVPPRFDLNTDGRYLVEIRKDAFQAWDLQTRHSTLSLARPPLSSYQLSNEVFALEDGDRAIQLWSLSTGKPLAAVRPDQPVRSIDLTPSGDLVTTSANRLSFWEARIGKWNGAAYGHESPITYFDISPDGKLIATGTEYGLVRIWDLQSGLMLVGPLRHRDKIDSVQFELSDSPILLAQAWNRLRLWDTRTGQPKSTNIRVEGKIERVQLSPDGSRILLHIDRKPVRLLDARTGQPLVRPPVATEQLSRTAFSRNGQIIWVASPHQVHVFAVPRFPGADRDLLARWAEAVGGWAIDDDGQLVELSDQLVRLEALRRETADAPTGQLRAASLIRWFLSDPKTRPVSPVFERTIASGH